MENRASPREMNDRAYRSLQRAGAERVGLLVLEYAARESTRGYDLDMNKPRSTDPSASRDDGVVSVRFCVPRSHAAQRTELFDTCPRGSLARTGARLIPKARGSIRGGMGPAQEGRSRALRPVRADRPRKPDRLTERPPSKRLAPQVNPFAKSSSPRAPKRVGVFMRAVGRGLSSSRVRSARLQGADPPHPEGVPW